MLSWCAAEVILTRTFSWISNGNRPLPWLRTSQIRSLCGSMRPSVSAIQHRVQAIAPAFLQAVTIDERSYVLRELLPTEDRLQLEHWHGKSRRLERVMDVMGKLVAWGHLRSGGRQGSATTDTLITFASQATWQKPLLEYAISYRAQVMQDWQRFCEAYECGELKI